MTRYARKLLVEPSATEGLGVNSAAIHGVFFRFSLHCVEMSASKPWLPCSVFSPGSDGKVEKDTVTLGEEQGEITFVVEGHDAERGAAVFKNLDCCENYQ